MAKYSKTASEKIKKVMGEKNEERYVVATEKKLPVTSRR